MATVAIELQSRPVETDEVEFIEDVEVLSESDRCSCAASDDNPY